VGWSVCFYIDLEIPRVRAHFPACLVVRYFGSLFCDFWLPRVLILDWSVDLEWFLCTVQVVVRIGSCLLSNEFNCPTSIRNSFDFPPPSHWKFSSWASNCITTIRAFDIREIRVSNLFFDSGYHQHIGLLGHTREGSSRNCLIVNCFLHFQSGI